MTSPTRIAANRQNAKKSTGPRSRAGKDRVSRNALRHGLATDIDLDPFLAPQINALARAIAGPQAVEATILDAARTAAVAELDLIRIRRIRSDLLADLARLIAETVNEADEPSELALMQAGIRAGVSREALRFILRQRQRTKPSARISALIEKFARIERYERRAMSRRKGLFRALDALRPEEACEGRSSEANS